MASWCISNRYFTWRLSFIAYNIRFLHNSRVSYAPRNPPTPPDKSPESQTRKRRLFQENTRKFLQDSLSFLHYEQEQKMDAERVVNSFEMNKVPLSSPSDDLFTTSIVSVSTLEEFLTDNGGKNICFVNITEKSSLIPWLVIVDYDHGRKRRALANLLFREYRHVFPDMAFDAGEKIAKDDEWIAMNMGPILLHIMSPEARKLYDLEGLWSDQVSNVNHSDNI